MESAAGYASHPALPEPYQIDKVRSFGEKRRLQAVIRETIVSLVQHRLGRSAVLLGFMKLLSRLRNLPGPSVAERERFELAVRHLIQRLRGAHEIDLVLGFLRVFEIQRVDLQQREIALAFFRAANVTFDSVAGAKSLPTQNASANAISRGDSVAILEKQKAAPKGGFSI